MKKKIILSFLLIFFIKSIAQQKNIDNDKKFQVSLHYSGNIRNDNFIGDNYNGILGVYARYTILKKVSFAIQAGLVLDCFQSRGNINQLKVKDALIVNPNIGIEFNASKSFKPFINFGYSFFTAKFTLYSNTFTGASQYDPLIQGTSFNQCFNYNSISINPGFKPYFDQKFYA